MRSFRVITGCGSHGVGKSKLKNSVSLSFAFFFSSCLPSLVGDFPSEYDLHLIDSPHN